MLVISLTSIPPRFPLLPRVLEALLAQGADRVVLTLPRSFARFEPTALPALPTGVDVLETGTDLGPAGKLLAPARAFPEADILYCDDDWLYGPGWANAFRTVRESHPGAVIAGSSWATARIGHAAGKIVEGYAGVLVSAHHAARIPDPPAEAWPVDDIWLSGHFTGLGLDIVTPPGIRAALTPLASPGALQDTTPRDAANRAAAALIHEKFGIWQPLSPAPAPSAY